MLIFRTSGTEDRINCKIGLLQERGRKQRMEEELGSQRVKRVTYDPFLTKGEEENSGIADGEVLREQTPTLPDSVFEEIPESFAECVKHTATSGKEMAFCCHPLPKQTIYYPPYRPGTIANVATPLYLPDIFTTKEAIRAGTTLELSPSTVKRMFNKANSLKINKIERGKYQKDHK